MKKILVLFLLMLSFSISTYSSVEQEKVNYSKDLHEIKSKMDGAFHEMKDCGVILKDEVSKYGIKKTVQINSWFFLPLIIFIIMYLSWLKNRKK